VSCRDPDEVKEYCGAFMQVYREGARYLERTAPWVERVGLSYIKSRLIDDEVGRKALYKRFLASQQRAQVDPWKERAAGAQAHEFVPLQQVNG
jgi:nitrite reductase (NADH) large subunit